MTRVISLEMRKPGVRTGDGKETRIHTGVAFSRWISLMSDKHLQSLRIYLIVHYLICSLFKNTDQHSGYLIDP